MATYHVGRRPPGGSDRYRPLPTGTHGLDPDAVKLDQRARLQSAMIELIAQKGYQAVRIVDLARLAHVSQPTFYDLYADKEDLFMSAYDEVAAQAARTITQSFDARLSYEQRVRVALRAWAQLASDESEATSLLVLGAFGAGAKALERRRRIVERLERAIAVGRADPPSGRAKPDEGDLTVKALIGGIREITGARLRAGRAGELPALADQLTAWASCYPQQLPEGVEAPPAKRPQTPHAAAPSERARRAEGRLPSGRSDLPRQFIVKSQRERIVDATAAIVAEKGLAGLKVPDIARRANVSLQTFYGIYASKHEAFLGAQKVGMHQALGVAVAAYQAEGDDWPRAVSAGLRALIQFLTSEPVHAHLSVVDTFAACPEALEIRNSTLLAFGAYFGPGYELARDRVEVPPIAGEAIAGGIWQVLHHYVENDCVAELPLAAPQLIYFALTPFVGVDAATEVARETAAELAHDTAAEGAREGAQPAEALSA